MDKMKYKIVRMFFDDDKNNRTIKEDLTLDQAQKWCKDTETSSSTCRSEAGLSRTEIHGVWFDGYESY